MKFKFLLLLFISSITFISCNEDDSLLNISSEPYIKYFPLKVGNKWNYKIEGLQSRYLSWEVVSKEADDVYNIETKTSYSSSLTTIDTIKAKPVPDGIIFIESDYAGYFLRSPFIVNASWTLGDTASNHIHLIIIEDNLTYSVPAGIFENCIKVKWKRKNADGTTVEMEKYFFIFAPNVGLIALGKDDYFLESYTLK